MDKVGTIVIVVSVAIVGLGLYLVLEQSGSDGAAPAASASAEPGLRTPPPRPGVNPALARMKALGEVKVGEKGLEPARPDMARRAVGGGQEPSGAADAPASPSPGASSAPTPAAKPGDKAALAQTWGLDKNGIQGAVREAMPQVRECYEEWLKLNPKLGGRVLVAFTIEAVEGEERGKVIKAELAEKSLGHAPMEGCILSVFEDLRFERPKDGSVKVNYPLIFASGELDAAVAP